MPGGDRTGPGGMGPMTGRAAGYCAGYPVPGFTNPIAARGYGFGFGRGYGFGRGMGFGFRGGRGGGWAAPYYGYRVGYGMPYTSPYAAPYATPYAAASTREQEIEALKGQSKYFENALAEITKRIAELETEEESEE